MLPARTGGHDTVKVYILDNGYLECDQNWMVAMSVVGTRDCPRAATNWIRIPVFAVLIDHHGRKILYDTGCHPAAMQGYWPASLQGLFPHHCEAHQSLTHQLALAHTAPEEIRTVVLSHLHLDHAGNLHQFPDADVYVPRKDFEHGLALVRRSPDPGDHGAYIKADLEVPARRYHLVDEDQEVADGVSLINLPGHTPGLLGLAVELGRDGTLIFPQDAVYTRANYGPPVRLSGLVYDSLAFLDSIEKVRSLAAKSGGRVMFSHDMEFFHTLKRAPDCYE